MKKFLLVLFSTVLSTFLEAKTLIVVRHADRQVAEDKLTRAGLKRADALRDMLVSEKVGLILSTDTNRTKQTVGPLATNQGISITIYDEMAELVQKINGTPAELIVIVGHSNTVPTIVKQFSNVVVPAIDENEYDRLYIFVQNSQTLLKLKYGGPNVASIFGIDDQSVLENVNASENLP